MAARAARPPHAVPAARRRLLCAGLVGGATALATLAACSLADVDHASANAPQAAPWPRPARLVWVFGSGGPRGFVHVGVLKALHELKLRPDAVVGASVGALVATLFAADLPAAELERLALTLQPWQLLRWQAGGEETWAGDGIAAFVNQQLGGRALHALALPVACAVQRLGDGAVLGFTRGDAGLAVQAAAAIEGRLAPLRIGTERYADADLRQPLPVRLARGLGAQRVLAVDASAYEERAPAEAARFRASDLRKRALTRPDAAQADVLLHPDTGYWTGISRDYRERAIAAGYAATLAQADALRALHR